MPPKFFKYLSGELGLPTEPVQSAEGYFECETCYTVSHEAEVYGGYVRWTCTNNHKNEVAYNG